MKKCVICNSTDRVYRFKGGEMYCSRHYNQMYRMGYTTLTKKKMRENKVIYDNDTVKLITVKGEEILIDRIDYDKIKEYYWSVNSQGYAISVINGKHKRLHLMILDKPKNFVIDHINGNKLDNRRSNLRICTCKENSRNVSASKNNKTGHLGISLTKFGRYRARIMVDGKEIRLGNYVNLEDAIKARKKAEIKYFGEYSPTLSRHN